MSACAVVGITYVADSEINGEPEADERIPHHDGREGRRGQEGDEPEGDYDVREERGLGPPEPDTKRVHEGRGGDESERVADEDERDDGVADVIMPSREMVSMMVSL